MNHAKIFKGQPRRDALSELVPDWYRKFLPDHIDLAEMNQPTGLSNKTITAWSYAEDQILEHLILFIFVLNDRSNNFSISGN